MKKNKTISYFKNLSDLILNLDIVKISELASIIKKNQKSKKQIFICGNGGSSANAEHITNDLMLGMNSEKMGYRFLSLNSNSAKLTCIANDLGYEKIFSHQLKIIGDKGDLLIVLSGSGNSKNIVEAIKQARKQKILTFGLIGYDGGLCKKICDKHIHFKSYDMQICEDLQMIVMNQVMKILKISF